ncbi:hypothetical protein SK355_11025 [Candidatus Fukatsuia symbiotica]|nr:hypothetical protein [Candidatus Fukatsuia symbiotica]MEA9445719.1 hypothetical protein [Candidatus Fukatsuia symbiotica]
MLQEVMREPSEMIYIGITLYKELETFSASINAHCEHGITVAHFTEYLI